MTKQPAITNIKAVKNVQAVAIKVLRACTRRSNREAHSAPARRGPVEASLHLSPPNGQGMAFRARAGAAPLETATPRSNAGCSFRARAGAAPLKLLDASAGELIAGIPRPRGRGPVEAWSSSRIVSGDYIPRPRGRGPVEALRTRVRALFVHSAPARARPR